MDYQDIIKIEQQSVIYSTGNHSHRYMSSFYDNDSEIEKNFHPTPNPISENPQYYPQHYQQNYQSYKDDYTSEQIIDYLQKYINITDMTLEQIIQYIDQIQIAQGVNQTVLKKKILKRKNLLKRYRAKNRPQKNIFAGLTYNYMPTLPQHLANNQTQVKKKRNRVSAQISRDRKKQYFKQLEDKNLQLEQQILQTKLQNEQLKKSINEQNHKSIHPIINEKQKDYHKNQYKDKKNYLFEQSFNNKLTRLLVFLGILCLIGMIKQNFFSAVQGKFNNVHKIDAIRQGEDFNAVEHYKQMEEGKQKVAEFLDEEVSQKSSFSMLPEQPKQKLHTNFNGPVHQEKRFHFFSNLISHLQTMKDSLYRSSS